jgi:hypothetical protein
VSKFFDQEDDVGEPKLQHCYDRIGVSLPWVAALRFPENRQSIRRSPDTDDERFCSALSRVQRRKPVLLKRKGGIVMQTATRNFDTTSVPGLSAEARKAVNAAVGAISTWRTETVNNSEKNLAQVIDKMAAAARALGWPEQIVDVTRAQMQSVTKMQIQVMDHMSIFGRNRSNRQTHRL